MMHKKRLSCLLAMLMISSAFSGCTETSEETETAETAPVQEEIQTETISFEDMSFVERMQYTRADIHDGLPERIITATHSASRKETTMNDISF